MPRSSDPPLCLSDERWKTPTGKSTIKIYRAIVRIKAIKSKLQTDQTDIKPKFFVLLVVAPHGDMNNSEHFVWSDMCTPEPPRLGHVIGLVSFTERSSSPERHERSGPAHLHVTAVAVSVRPHA